MLMTVSRLRLHLVLPLPSFGLPIGRAWSTIHQYIRAYFHGQNDCPLLTLFLLLPFDLYFPLFQHYISSGLPSHCFDFVALFSSSRNGTVLYLLHPRWHARLLSTLLIDDTVTRPPAIGDTIQNSQKSMPHARTTSL